MTISANPALQVISVQTQGDSTASSVHKEECNISRNKLRAQTVYLENIKTVLAQYRAKIAAVDAIAMQRAD
jgi:hypothetical protein